MSNAGDLKITTGQLNIRDGGIVTSLALSTVESPATVRANAGDIFIQARNIDLVGADSWISSSLSVNTTGSGGNIEIQTQGLMVSNGATLSSRTFGNGDAGDLVINARDLLVFQGFSEDGQASTAVSSVQEGARGDGGNIEIRARAVRIIGEEDAQFLPGFFANASGDGNSGGILIIATDELDVNNGEINTFSSQTSGGAITVITDQIQLTGDSDITTLVASGAGRGGDITLAASDFIIALDDSDILASVPEGQGGNITLQTPGFFGENFTLASLEADPNTLDGNDRVDINATGAVNGVVSLPDISFIENSLNTLPEAIIPSERLLAGSCIARAGDEQGRFVVTGGGGLPARPGDSVAVYPTGDIQPVTGAEPQALWRSGDPIVEPTGVFALADGRLVLSQECDEL